MGFFNRKFMVPRLLPPSKWRGRSVQKTRSTIKNNTKSSYVLFIPLAVYAFKLLEAVIHVWTVGNNNQINFVTPKFVESFIEWFGVLYGILLPLILVRVWEQLDNIDREFDREADTVKILYKDISLLDEKHADIVKKITSYIRDYVLHVLENYPNEIKKTGDKGRSSNKERKSGDGILERIREQFRELIHVDKLQTSETEYLIPELFKKLNDIVDIRGDRIALASQRLFESLRVVALITSIIFVIPFYFVSFLPSSGLLDNLLTIGITLLVIFIYLLVEDFDEPFGGVWKIDNESWKRISEEMKTDQGK